MDTISKEITNQYMGLLPLWSVIMLGDLSRYVPDVQPAEMRKGDAITRDTNSIIENYFGNLKAGLHAKQRYRVTNFIRDHYTRISGRLIESRTYQPKNTLKRITKRTKDTSDIEQWKRTSKRSRSYFTPPKKLRMPNKVNKGKKLISPPLWGGTYTREQKVTILKNTCPLDGLLYIMVLVFSTNPIYVRERDESTVSTVVAVCQEVQRHGWAAGKIMWLEINNIKYEEIVHSPLSSTWNCYGAQFEMFARAFGGMFRAKRMSECTNDQCSEKVKELELIQRYFM